MSYTHEEVADIAQRYSAVSTILGVTHSMDVETARVYASKARQHLDNFRNSIPLELQEFLMRPLEGSFKDFVKYYIRESAEAHKGVSAQ